MFFRCYYFSIINYSQTVLVDALHHIRLIINLFEFLDMITFLSKETFIKHFGSVLGQYVRSVRFLLWEVLRIKDLDVLLFTC